MILPFLSTYWGAGIWAKTCDNVPISALRKGVRYEKYIQTLPISYRLKPTPFGKICQPMLSERK
jgi:hypothetical protein